MTPDQTIDSSSLSRRNSSFIQRFLSPLFPRGRARQEIPGLGELTRLVRRFSVEQQQVPRDLSELVARKYLTAEPKAPPGHKFVVDRNTVEVKLEEAKSSHPKAA